MEPDVAPMYSSSPPPLDDGAVSDEEDDDFGDFADFTAAAAQDDSFPDLDAAAGEADSAPSERETPRRPPVDGFPAFAASKPTAGVLDGGGAAFDVRNNNAAVAAAPQDKARRRLGSGKQRFSMSPDSWHSSDASMETDGASSGGSSSSACSSTERADGGISVASHGPGLVNGFDAEHPAKGKTLAGEIHEQCPDNATMTTRRRRSAEPSPGSTPCASPCPSQDGFGDFEVPGAVPRLHPASEMTVASTDGVGAAETNDKQGLPGPAESWHPRGSGEFADFVAFASSSHSVLRDGEGEVPGDMLAESEHTARGEAEAEADARETLDSGESEPHSAAHATEVDERPESPAGTTDALPPIEDTEFADFSSAAFASDGTAAAAATVDAERTCLSVLDSVSHSCDDAAAKDESHARSGPEPGADDSRMSACADTAALTRTPPLTVTAELPLGGVGADGAAHATDSERTSAESPSAREPPANLEDADGFGDFDVATTTAPTTPAASVTPAAHTVLSEQPAVPGDEEEFADFSAQVPRQLSADDAEGDDDFGSFREASAAKSPASEDDFGDFGTAATVSNGDRQGSLTAGHSAEFGDFASEQAAGDGDGFADFSRARSPLGEEEEEEEVEEGETRQRTREEEEGGWAAFGTAQSNDDFGAFGEAPGATGGAHGVEFGQGGEAAGAGAAVTAPASVSTEQQPSLLQRVFQACFPCPALTWANDAVALLREVMTNASEGDEEQEVARHRPARALWAELVETDDAHGLRYQWGGSHTNKRLLSALGIDTRNILFTGQKKQPVIVPVYAAGLGMLEPTKGPMNPISAAEKIASIGQASGTAAPGGAAAASSDSAQEGVAAAQFDWSGSGLKNPLDANGASSTLNLDFFGPADEWTGAGQGASMPGVDPELFELTTAKMESASTVSRVTDAIARLMSTADKTITSARRPRREEKLSSEALSVMAALPDLSFMRAKVLMFPSTLTPAPACGAVGDAP